MSNKYESLTRACVAGILGSLEPLSDFIYEHERSFLEDFGRMDAMGVETVCFSTDGCVVVYRMPSGLTHTEAPIDDLIDWMLEIEEGLSL